MNPLDEKAAFEKACQLFYLRLFEGLEVLESAKKWWAAAPLCLIAIDVLANMTRAEGDTTGADYVDFIQNDPDLHEYAEYADAMYASLRCGLLHRMVPRDRGGRSTEDGEPIEPELPIALAPGDKPPRQKSDYLIVDVPHLIAAVRRAFQTFRDGEIDQRRRRFSKRMVQIVFEETENGLIVMSE